MSRVMRARWGHFFGARLADMLNKTAVLFLLLALAAPLMNSAFLDSYPFHGHLYLDPAHPDHRHDAGSAAARRAVAQAMAESRDHYVVSFLAPSGISDGVPASASIAGWSDLGVDVGLISRLLEVAPSAAHISAFIAPPDHPPQSS